MSYPDQLQLPAYVSVREVMKQMIHGYWVSRAIYVAAKLGIADFLQDSAQSYTTIASTVNANPEAVYRLLRALASVGVFVEEQPGYFALTPLAACLRTEISGSLRFFSIMYGELEYEPWDHLLETVQTGQSAFEQTYGMPVFQYYEQHPEKQQVFNQAMQEFHGAEANAIASSYDFSQFGQVIDIAGGKGGLLTAILRQYPTLAGSLFDRPTVIADAQPFLVDWSDRCQLIAGDFFESIPTGYDAYILKHIIHDWNDEQCLTILRNCRQAMTPENKLLVVETIVPEGNEPSRSKWLDLHMMTITGGKERTAAEYRALYAAAGFELTRIVPTIAGVSVIEGIPV